MLEESPIRRQLRAPPSPTMRDVLAVVFRQRRLFAWSFAVTFAIVLLYGIMSPNYEAHMRVLVRRGRLDPVMTAEVNTPPQFARSEVGEEELNSEVELLRDEQLLKNVALAAGVVKPSLFTRLHLTADDAEGNAQRAARTLAQQVQVAAVKRTNLIQVAYRADSPAEAARVLQALMAQYLEKHAAVHRPSGESRFFDQQTAQYQERLAAAERSVASFTRERGVVSAALERDIALQKLGEADAGARLVRQGIANQQKRIEELGRQLAKLPERSTTEVRTSDNPILLEKLKTKVLELQLKRTELVTKFEPSYRLVRQVDEQIAEARQAIVAENLTPVREQITAKDANYEWAKAELARAFVDLGGLQAQELAANGQLAALRQSARQFQQDALVQGDRTRQAKAEEDDYLLYRRKREEARIGDALDERGIVNVAVVQEPVAPAIPVHSFLAFLLAGFGAASVMSVGTVFVADYLDPALRTPEEVIYILGAPLLASLPEDAA